MVDFIVEMAADMGEIFLDLWINQVINRKQNRRFMGKKDGE